MSFAHSALSATDCGNDVNAVFAFLNATECDVAAVGRPAKLEAFTAQYGVRNNPNGAYAARLNPEG